MSRYLAPLVMGIVGTAILIALGNWQLQRLSWKQGVLAEIEQRMDSAPTALPVEANEQDHKFSPVIVDGVLDSQRALIFTPMKDLGVRFRVIHPLELPDGRRILLEIGVVAPEVVDEVDFAGPVEAKGMLHWPDEFDAFTPKREGSVWYARDVVELAKEFGTEPLLVVAGTIAPAHPLILTLPLDPTRIPNDHLQYAVTWFGLAIVWVGMTILWLRRISRTRTLER